MTAVPDFVRTLPADELPAYVHDLDALRGHAAHIRSCLGGRAEFQYAVKANPDARVLTALAPYVDGYEVSSGGEVDHVSETVPDLPLAFGGPGKTPAEIATALRRKVARFHVESAHELRVLASLAHDHAASDASPVGVLLRVNLPVAGGLPATTALAMGGRPSPFGIDPGEVDDLVRQLTDGSHPGLRWYGVHAHLASGLTAPQQLDLARQIVTWSAALAARHRAPLAEVNIGGGMAVDYARPSERFDWAAFGTGLADLADDHPESVLKVEPGRAVTVYGGWYATDVLDVKRSHGETFAVLRGGTHHLRTPATKGHDQPCTVLAVDDWPHPWPRPAAPDGEPVTFVGQLCTPKDVLARRVPAPGLRAGDRVLFALAGAYAWNISHHDFLMHPEPRFHYLGAP